MKTILTFLFLLVMSSNIFAQDPGDWIRKNQTLNGTTLECIYFEFSDTLKTKPYTFQNVMTFEVGSTVQIDQIHIINVETSKVLYVIGKLDDTDTYHRLEFDEDYVVLVTSNENVRGMLFAQVINLNTWENENLAYKNTSELVITNDGVKISKKL